VLTSARLLVCSRCPSPLGRFDTQGGSGCWGCYPGKYGVLAGQDEAHGCADCPSGRFSSVFGPTEVLSCDGECPLGRYGSGPGQQSDAAGCADCPLGRYGPDVALNSSDACTVCPPGRAGLAAGTTNVNDGCWVGCTTTIPDDALPGSCGPTANMPSTCAPVCLPTFYRTVESECSTTLGWVPAVCYASATCPSGTVYDPQLATSAAGGVTPAGAAPSSQAGSAVAISQDGMVMVVGAPGHAGQDGGQKHCATHNTSIGRAGLQRRRWGPGELVE
jgi:hypothetical protein